MFYALSPEAAIQVNGELRLSYYCSEQVAMDAKLGLINSGLIHIHRRLWFNK
jgi:hypothetical protein